MTENIAAPSTQSNSAEARLDLPENANDHAVALVPSTLLVAALSTELRDAGEENPPIQFRQLIDDCLAKA